MFSTECQCHDVHVLFGGVGYEIKRKFIHFSNYHKSFHIMS